MDKITIAEAKADKLKCNKFIEENTGLIHTALKSINIYFAHMDFEDYFQVGCIGLMKAIKKFNADYGYEFSTYAVPIIRGEAQRYRREFYSGPKISRTIRGLYFNYNKLSQKGYTNEEISKILNVSLNEIEKSIIACQSIISLQNSYDKDSVVTEKTIPDSFSVEDYVVDKHELKYAIDMLKHKLADKELRVLKIYLQDKTQSYIASKVNFSQAHVSRIIKRILNKAEEVHKEYFKAG